MYVVSQRLHAVKKKGQPTSSASPALVPPPPPSMEPQALAVLSKMAALSVSDLEEDVAEPPPPSMEPQALAVVSVADLEEDALRNVLRRLFLADLLRAAVACQRWRRVAVRCIPGDPPLLGYFFHPKKPRAPLPVMKTSDVIMDAVFTPLGGVGVDVASSPRLSLDFAPDASRYALHDCYKGLLLLQPSASLPKGIIPRFLVLDPATRRRALLPTPPRDTLPEDRLWRTSRHYVGSALLSRGHPSKLCFEVVCFTIDGGHPRSWVASYDDGECRWRALQRAMDVEVTFDPWWFESHCVHAAGNIYWHICNSGRVLALDPATLNFSYLLVPDELGAHFCSYRIGETPEDGRLCIVTVENERMQIWVRGNIRCNDNGWFVQRQMKLSKVYDAVPTLPRDKLQRKMSIMISDIDAGRTGKLFIKTLGHGRYSLDMKTGEMKSLMIKGGQEYGHPLYAYLLAWPPAFLAPEY